MLAVSRTKTHPVLLPALRLDESTPRHRPRRRNAVARALAVAVLVVLPAIFYVSQRAQIAKTGYHILQLRHEVRTLQNDNARLLATATALKSLDRIERIATKELGMRPPRQQQLATITVPAPVTALPAPVEANSMWDRLLARLGSSEAEAGEARR